MGRLFDFLETGFEVGEKTEMTKRIQKKTRGLGPRPSGRFNANTQLNPEFSCNVMSKRRKRRGPVASHKMCSTISAGAAVVDITPPLEVGLLTSSVKETWAPFQSVRSPLKARVLFLQFGRERIALLSLDLLGLTGAAVGGWTRFKRSLARATSMAPNRIVITCTHTHNGPESVAITNLYRSKLFRRWLREVEGKLARAIKNAAAEVQPCTLSCAATELRGFSLQRRIPTPRGIVMSDSVQPITPALMRRGPIDRRVHGIFLRDPTGRCVATIIHAACHPVHEMCLPQISADFPGELCAALESTSDYVVPIFFNGAAGDINPPTVSGGAKCARRHGQALAQVIERTIQKARTVGIDFIAFKNSTVHLPARSLGKNRGPQSCVAHLNALRLGSLAMVFVPGELFVETALAIERASPFNRTLVIGFAESSIGYVPTRKAFREGGYEIGPGKWSFLQAGAESILRREIVSLLRELWKVKPT